MLIAIVIDLVAATITASVTNVFVVEFGIMIYDHLCTHTGLFAYCCQLFSVLIMQFICAGCLANVGISM